MAKISDYPDGGAIQATDQLIVGRAGHNKSILGSNVGGGLPVGHIFGLTLSNGTDAVNDINIAAGKCRNSTDSNDIVLASALLGKQLDAVWAVGTNAGMRASGAVIANTTYHIFLIKRPDTGVVDVAADTSVTGGNIAANTNVNYTIIRRIGSIVRLGNTILAFLQVDEQFWWVGGEVLDVNGGVDVTGTLKTLTLPTGIKVEVILNAEFAVGAGGGSLRIFDPDIGTTINLTAIAVVLSGTLGARVRSYTNTSAQIRYYVSGLTATAYIYTQGWIDTRGRLS